MASAIAQELVSPFCLALLAAIGYAQGPNRFTKVNLCQCKLSNWGPQQRLHCSKALSSEQLEEQEFLDF